MLLISKIEKYLESCNCVFSSYDRYVPDNVNRRHIIEVELNDGSDVVFDILFNPTCTDATDDWRYHLSIYNGDASGDLMKTYSNNTADRNTIINKVVKYKDRFKRKDNVEKNKISERKSNNITNIIKINESQLRNIVAESLNRILNEEQNVEKWLASGWHKFPDEIPEIGRKVVIADSNNNVEGHLSTPIAWDGETFRTNLAHTIRYVDVNDVTFWRYWR